MIPRLRRLLDRLNLAAAGDTVWVTGHRSRRPHCVSLLMSREDAELLGEMLRDVAGEDG